MRNASWCVAVFLCLGAIFPRGAVVVEPQQPTISLPPELARVLTDYESAWSHKDSAAVARLFTEDAFVLSPGRPMVRGRKLIERFYDGSGGPLSLRPVAFATHGSVGYIIGGFSSRPDVPDTGKFTLTLREEATGRWVIMSDMDNDNVRR
jgi:ketosteroid isomerase-like protein